MSEDQADVRIVLLIAVMSLLAGLGQAATLHVPAEHATVQQAVDSAAPGDTVQVATGVYEEQVVIAVPLTLRGAGPAHTTIVAPLALPHAVGAANYRAVICVDDAAGPVTVIDLAIDGLGRQPASGRFVGLMFYRRGGVARRLEIRNIHHTPADASTSGIGVLASLDAPSAEPAITLEDIQVTAFQKAGVVVASRGQSAILTRVHVDAQDVVTDAVPNGIELATVDNARLTDCTVEGVSHGGLVFPGDTAAGLLAVNCDDLMVDDGTFTHCLTGVYLEGTSAVLDGLAVSQPAASAAAAHGLVSVTGSIEVAAAGVPAPRPTVAGPVVAGRSGLEVYEVLVRDGVFEGDLSPSSRGVALNTFSARAQRLVLERCRIAGWGIGVRAGEDPTLFGAVFGRFSGCRIAGNVTAGITSETITPLDARGCLWGDPSGPQHPQNPGGLGDPVSDHVLFDPWLTGNLAPLPLPQSISLADFDGLAYHDTISVEYLGGGDEGLYGFSVRLTWDPSTIEGVAVEPPVRGAFAGAPWFFADLGPGAAQVDAALGGLQAGITTGPLFTVTYRAVGAPDGVISPLTLELLQARDTDNQPITGLSTDDGALIVDLHPPVISVVELFNQTLAHTDDFAKDGDQVSVRAEITDGHPDFGRGDIRGVGAPIFGAPWVFGPPDQYDGAVATWNARTVLTNPVGNGVRAFQVSAFDPAGNAAEIVDDTIILDNLAPAAVSGLQAVAGHNTVSLNWDDPAGQDLNYRHTVVRANAWGDYPIYGTPEPTYPDGTTAGDSVYTGTAASHAQSFPADGSGRDILYYAVLAEDMAGNLSPLGDGSTARTTSYRVGDLAGAEPGDPGDGQIDAPDLGRLDASLGRLAGDDGFDAECDVAPADSVQAVIPVPDAQVDLDDLMLMAMRHDHQGVPAIPTEDPCTVTWTTVAPDTFALVLTAPCPQLKGLSLAASGGDALWTLEPGNLLLAQADPWFLSQGPGGCRAYLAMLGPDIGIDGTGELLRLVADRPASPFGVLIDLRSIHNEQLGDPTTDVDPQVAVPSSFRVPPPYPNPFNPSTTLAFELPTRQRVRVDIHALDGRRVRRLLEAELPAGRHQVRWLGRDDAGRPLAAGVYLYRLQAGPWSSGGKLGLVK